MSITFDTVSIRLDTVSSCRYLRRVDNNTAQNGFLAIDDAARANTSTHEVKEQYDDKGETEFVVNTYSAAGVWLWQESFTTRSEAEANT